MEAEQQKVESDKQFGILHKIAKLALVSLLLNIVFQIASVYQTRHQLVSPIVPESAIWEINKQFIFQAIVSAIASVIAILLYFFEKYRLVIILATVVLIVGRFIFV